jgi:hypothetical protein
MVRKFPGRYFDAVRIGLAVAVFPLIFLFGVAMSTVRTEPRPQLNGDTGINETGPPAETHGVLANNPITIASSDNKKNAVPDKPQPSATAIPEQPVANTVAEAEPEYPAQAVITVSDEKPVQEATCPDGTYIDGNDNEVCRPPTDDTEPPGGTLPCRIGSLVPLGHVDAIICDENSV